MRERAAGAAAAEAACPRTREHAAPATRLPHSCRCSHFELRRQHEEPGLESELSQSGRLFELNVRRHEVSALARCRLAPLLRLAAAAHGCAAKPQSVGAMECACQRGWLPALKECHPPTWMLGVGAKMVWLMLRGESESEGQA